VPQYFDCLIYLKVSCVIIQTHRQTNNTIPCPFSSISCQSLASNNSIDTGLERDDGATCLLLVSWT